MTAAEIACVIVTFLFLGSVVLFGMCLTNSKITKVANSLYFKVEDFNTYFVDVDHYKPIRHKRNGDTTWISGDAPLNDNCTLIYKVYTEYATALDWGYERDQYYAFYIEATPKQLKEYLTENGHLNIDSSFDITEEQIIDAVFNNKVSNNTSGIIKED